MKTSSERAKISPWRADPNTSHMNPRAYWVFVTYENLSESESNAMMAMAAVMTTMELIVERLIWFLTMKNPKMAEKMRTVEARREAVEAGR